MGVDVLQRLDRRGFLAAAAVALTAGSGPVFGQTLIQETPMSDVGFSRGGAAVSSVYSPRSAPPAQSAAAPAQASPMAEKLDWRKYLIAGERSILMRRDGAAQRVRYCTADGQLDREGYARACQLMRDVRAGKLFPIDPKLLDILCGLQRWAEYNGRNSIIQLLSGFRTLATNGATEGAAMNSMHLYGRAADVVFEGISSGMLGAMARSFNSQGGTGLYLNQEFVHVDTGAARMWASTSQSRRR